MDNFRKKNQETRLHVLNKAKNATSAIWGRKNFLRGKKGTWSGANIQYQPQGQSPGRACWIERERDRERGERSRKVWDVASNLASAAFPRLS